MFVIQVPTVPVLIFFFSSVFVAKRLHILSVLPLWILESENKKLKIAEQAHLLNVK